MLKRVRSLATLFALVSGLAEGNEITNGGFDTDLSGWAVSGDVMQDAGAAVLGDDGAVYSALYQAVTGAGRYRLEFDFLNGLSSDVPQGSFFDAFFATVYLTNDIGSLDVPSGIYHDFLALLDMDAAGAFNLAGGAIVGPSVNGGDWQHFSLSFRSGYGFLAPAFELTDWNFVDADSTVAIDNVTLTQLVPSPPPLALIALGLLVLRRDKWGSWRYGYHR